MRRKAYLAAAVITVTLAYAQPAAPEYCYWYPLGNDVAAFSGDYWFDEYADPIPPPGPDDHAQFSTGRVTPYFVEFDCSPTNLNVAVWDYDVTFLLNGNTYTARNRARVGGGNTKLTLTGGTLQSAHAYAEGTAVVGLGANWNSDNLTFGFHGTGTLIIREGGQVSNTDAYIGHESDSNGQVTVTGSGSTWNADNLMLGAQATATLTITNGGQVSSQNAYIDGESGSNGHVTVTGSGSTWNSDHLTVGSQGNGTLTIAGGGRVSTQDAYIGRESGSNGHVTVTGSGSTWNSDNLTLGPHGSATFSLELGGHARVNETLHVWSTDASVVLDGGSLSVGALDVPGDYCIYLNDPAGEAAALTIRGMGTDDTFSGTIADTRGGTGSLRKAGAHVLTLDGVLAYSGSTYVDEGTLLLPQGMGLPGDTVHVAQGATLQAGNLVNRAVAGSGTIIAESDVLLLGDGARADGFRFDGHLQLDDNTFMLLDADAAELGASTTLAAGGRLDALYGIQLGPEASVDPARVLSADGAAVIASDFRNNGTVHGPGGDDWLTFTDEVTGAGSYTGNIELSDGFSPGNSTAAVSLENVAMDATNTLSMEIGGTQPGVLFDQLLISGNAELAGTLELDLLDDYALDPLVNYELIEGTVTGRFGRVEGLEPGWDVIYAPTGVTLAVPEPSTVALLLAGAMGLLVAATRRRLWTNRNSYLTVALIVATTVCGASASASDYYWNGPVNGIGGFRPGSFSNWLGPAPYPALRWPRTDDTAHFSQQIDQTYFVWFDVSITNGKAYAHTGDVTFLLNGNTYTLTEDFQSIVVGDTAGHSAKLTLDNGTLQSVGGRVGGDDATGTVVVGAGAHWSSSSSIIYVGPSGTGTITVQDGGQVSSRSVFLGSNRGSTGQVMVTGNGSNWSNSSNIFLGTSDGSIGTLTVRDGGQASCDLAWLGDDKGSQGQVTVTGSGSRWNPTSINLGAEGTGTLTIEDRGLVSSAIANFGIERDGNGRVTVTGQGANWSNSGGLLVGELGKGTLTVKEGGHVDSQSPVLGRQDVARGEATVTDNGTWTSSGALTIGDRGTGKLNIGDNGFVDSHGGTLAAESGSLGEVWITGSGTWESSAALTIAGKGTGKLYVENGGQLSSGSGTVNIGSAADSHGQVLVSGEMSNWSNAGDVYVGRNGRGGLVIHDGGQVTNQDACIGDTSQVDNQVTVIGTGSTWNSEELNVGRGGAGMLYVREGGQVFSRIGVLACESGSQAFVSVTDNGSTWSSSNELRVGYRGLGQLEIENGGHIDSLGGCIGSEDTADGQVTVTGSGSNWSNSVSLVIGRLGRGRLEIKEGGHVSSLEGAIGAGGGANGQVIVTGAESTWSNSSVLYLGSADTSTGTLAIEDGGQVSSLVAELGRSADSSGRVTVTGRGSTWSNPGSLIVGKGGTGILEIENGGQVSSEHVLIGESDGSHGQITVTGSGSTWNVEDLTLGREGKASLAVLDGGNVDVAEVLSLGKEDASLVVDGGTLSVGAIAGINRSRIQLNDPLDGTAALTIRGKGTDDTFSETIADAPDGCGSLRKTGAQMLTLDGLLTYSGSTYADEGTLLLPQGLGLPGDTVQVAQAATLRVGNLINRAVAGGGTIIAESDLLLLGDAARADGFRFDGHLQVDDNTFLLLDADAAELGVSTTMAAGGRLDSLGGMQLGPDASVDSARVLSADGAVVIAGNFRNNGTVHGPEGDQWLTFIDEVTGAGSYTGNIIFSDGFYPGNSTAVVSLENLAMDATNTLLMEIGGTEPGAEFDQLLVSGQARLGGTLQLDLLGDYVLEPACSYELISGASMGRFDGVEGLSLGWQVFYTPTAVVLAVPEPSTVVLLLIGAISVVLAVCRRWTG